MTDITPADMARFVHPVPVGATIPAGMEYAALMDGGLYTIKSLADHAPGRRRCWTAEPLAAPKPPLPTEAGAVIANVRGPMGSTCPVMTLDRDGEWLGVDSDGILIGWAADWIADWTPARIVTDEAVTAPSVNVGSLKMAREALCVAEHMMLKGLATPAQIGQIGAMIADIDRQRPVGPDGRHGSRHTATCGCEDR